MRGLGDEKVEWSLWLSATISGDFKTMASVRGHRPDLRN